MDKERTPKFVEGQAYFDILAAQQTHNPAPKAYQMAIEGVREDVRHLWADMDSFEGFRIGLGK